MKKIRRRPAAISLWLFIFCCNGVFCSAAEPSSGIPAQTAASAPTGVLIALMTVFIIIAIAFGRFEWRRLEKIQAEIGKTAAELKRIDDCLVIARQSAAAIQQMAPNLRDKVRALFSDRDLLNLADTHPEEDLNARIAILRRQCEITKLFGSGLGWEDYLIDGLELYCVQKYEPALGKINRALELQPDLLYSWYLSGMILDELNRPEEALTAFEKVLDRDPANAKAWFNKGVILEELNRHEAGLAAYEKAVAIDPDYTAAWYNQGVALGESHKPAEALAAFEKVAGLDPRYTGAWYNMACIYAQANETTQALANLNRAIRFNPSCKQAAKADADFENLWHNAEFIKITQA